MIDGAALAANAKHCPELLDPDVVRQAGRTIETFADLLAGLESHKRLGNDVELTFIVSRETHDAVMFHAFGGD
jgi:hypothetical protein